MQDLQQKILIEFKRSYPKDSLQKISKRTGIQITRVFRLLNGSEMKVKEYEAFQSCLNQTYSHGVFLSTAGKCQQNLKQQKVKELLSRMHYELNKAHITSAKNQEAHTIRGV